MEPGDSLDAFSEASLRESAALFIFDMDVVMGLSPVMTYEHLRHRASSSSSAC